MSKKLILFFALISPLLANFNWQGYYLGSLLCDDCKGINVWLHLTTKNRYEMREKFLGQKNRYSRGSIKWLNNKTAYLMSNHKKIYLDQDNIKFSDNMFGSLSKVQSFRVGDKVLLIEPNSLYMGKSRGKKIVSFKAYTNFDKKTKQGYKSSRAKYLFYCGEQNYKIFQASYYKRRYAMGGFVYLDLKNTQSLLNIKDNFLLEEVYYKYCKPEKENTNDTNERK